MSVQRGFGEIEFKTLRRKSLILLVRPAGFEPATYGFVDRTFELPYLLKLQ